MKRLFTLLFSALLFCSGALSGNAVPAGAISSFGARNARAPAPDALGWALVEAQDGVTIAQGNAQTRLSPASTTKIMTCLVVLEHVEEDLILTVPEEACRTEGSSAYLRPGEKLTVRELLYCLMLHSANDAATALALCTAGSCEAFAGWMNEKAKALGLTDTHFQNPHGLYDPAHYTSAADLARLTCAALRNPAFAQIVRTRTAVVGTGESRRTLKNHNRLLWSLDGCVGVKTGYTIKAGRCLVSACRREDTTLVCVTLSCRNDWEAHTALYAYGFSAVCRKTLEAREFTLPYAESDLPVRVFHEGYTFLCAPDDTVRWQLICPHVLYAPLREGDVVGSLSILLDGNEIARLPVLCAEERAPAQKNFFRWIVDFLYRLFQRNETRGVS